MNTSTGAVVAPAPTQQACDLPTQPGGSAGAATTVAPWAAATAAVASDEWSSTTTSSSPGRSCGSRGARRCGSASASSRAGTTTASGGRSLRDGGSRRFDHSSNQPSVHPAAYNAQATARILSRVAVRAGAPVRSGDGRPPPSPRARGRRPRCHRGGSRRAALPAVDRHARPRARQLLRHPRRARRRPGRPWPARPLDVQGAHRRASPPPASRSSACTPWSSPTAIPITSAAPAGCATRPAPTSSPTATSA